ncbi:MAG TPA: rod shape-determining protein MreD [Acidimicrobiia bacterium]|jgi:rod shape-determining protein MreD|nr:rod shape-determining protein MreD [Acidimicrobiia bacterium]
MRRVLPLGLLVLTTVVVQVAFMPHLRLFGVVPDLGLVLAIAIAYHDDAETAAIVGFATGLGFDLFLRTPVGASALAYAVTGYATGVIQASLIRSSRWLPFVLGGLGGLIGGLIFAVIAILAGTDSLIHLTTVGIVARAALYDAIAALVVFPLVDRFVRTRVAPPMTWRD